MQDDFGSHVLEGIDLLRGLPSGREAAASARAKVTGWSREHPRFPTTLLAHREPGSLRVEHDLLVDHPAGGTLALCWRPDDGVPWSVADAQHWAANYVLTVDGESVTVQEALRMLRLSGQAHADLVTELVDQKLFLLAIRQDEPAVSDEELQDAADRFREAKGLFAAADMHRWLTDMGFTTEQFEAFLMTAIQARKLKHGVAAERIGPHFEAHRDGYDRVRFFRVDGLDEAEAADLRARARDGGLSAAAWGGSADGALPARSVGTLATRFAHTLPAPLGSAQVGDIVGPFDHEGGVSLAQVLGRAPAVLDEETEAAVRETVIATWLAERRGAAKIEWHWA